MTIEGDEGVETSLNLEALRANLEAKTSPTPTKNQDTSCRMEHEVGGCNHPGLVRCKAFSNVGWRSQGLCGPACSHYTPHRTEYSGSVAKRLGNVRKRCELF